MKTIQYIQAPKLFNGIYTVALLEQGIIPLADT